MMKKFDVSRRVLAMALSLIMVVSLLPVIGANAEATQNTGVVDASTMDSWKTFFDPVNVSTQHAGGIWTDKSVFSSAAPFADLGISLTGNGNFLVALSALAANSIVVLKDTKALEGYLTATVNGEAVEDFSADFVNHFVEVPPQTGDEDIVLIVLSILAFSGLIVLYVMRWNKRKWIAD